MILTVDATLSVTYMYISTRLPFHNSSIFFHCKLDFDDIGLFRQLVKNSLQDGTKSILFLFCETQYQCRRLAYPVKRNILISIS